MSFRSSGVQERLTSKNNSLKVKFDSQNIIRIGIHRWIRQTS